MSRSITPTNNSAAVAPGSTVVQQVYTSTGFNAGDYVYAYVSGGNQQIGFGRPSLTLNAYGASIANTAYATTQSATGRQAAYGPMQEAAAYSGSNMTGGSLLVPATQLSASGSYNAKIAVLTNGSIVTVWSLSTTLYASIFNSSGTLISSSVVINSNLYSGGNFFGICALSNGNYVITCVQGNGTQWAGWYNSSYTQYSAGTFGSAIYSSGYFDNTSFADPTTGNAYWANLNPTGSAYCGLFNNTSILGWTTSTLTTSTKQEMVQVLGVQSNARALHLSNSTSTNCNIFNITTGANLGVNISLPGFVQSTGTSFGFCTLLSGGGRFVYVGSNDGTNLIAYIYQWNGGSTAGSFSIVKTITLNTTGNFGNLCVKPGYDGGFTVTTAGISNYIVAYVVNYTGTDFSAATTYQTAITAYSQGTAITTYHATTTTGGLAISYNDSSSRPNFLVMAAQTLTSGSTLLYGTNTYTPSNNYYLLGVAATTAAAGSIGEVIVNGPAALGSTYPSVANQINFDYSSVGPPSRGNKGYVVGTTAVLKGYE